jgi:hypothetical protein
MPQGYDATKLRSAYESSSSGKKEPVLFRMSAQTARDNSMYPHFEKQKKHGKKISFEQPFLTSFQLK